MNPRNPDRPTGPGRQTWRVAAAWLLMALVLGGLVAGFVWAQLDHAGTVPGAALHAGRKVVWAMERLLVDELLANPFVLAIVAATLVLEFLIPAHGGQRKITPTLVNDIVWYVVNGVFQLTVMVFVYVTTIDLFDRYLGFLILDYAQGWPGWAKIAVAVLIADYLRWVTHFVRHKVSVLWHFHTIHHSQPELNFFTDERQHPLEFVVRWAIIFLPFLMLGVDVASTTVAVFALTWFSNFNHANIRLNFGPLRNILVSPQYHRIHHSPLAEHRDANFGVVFCFWDRLHGTQCSDAEIYPESGTGDPDCPVATRFAPGHQIATLIRQLAYPFYRVVGAEGPILPAPD